MWVHGFERGYNSKSNEFNFFFYSNNFTYISQNAKSFNVKLQSVLADLQPKIIMTLSNEGKQAKKYY